MFGALSESMTMSDWGLSAMAIACFGISLIAVTLYLRCAKKNARLVTALNNMSEGLCMFDASARLVLRNDRYIESLRPAARDRQAGRHPARADRASHPC